jgi:hypothetical protein
MAFNLEEWNKLSEAECERRYEQRLRGEEQGKNIAAFLAFILICALLIYVFTGSRRSTPDDEPVAPHEAKPISFAKGDCLALAGRGISHRAERFA